MFSPNVRGGGVREQKYTGTCLNGALWYNMHRKNNIFGGGKKVYRLQPGLGKFHENVREISKKLKIIYFCPILL